MYMDKEKTQESNIYVYIDIYEKQYYINFYQRFVLKKILVHKS